MPVVSLRERELSPGGAANTAANAAALGASVNLASRVGTDADGEALLSLLRSRGVGVDSVVRTGAPTVAKHRLVVADQVVARFDEYAGTPVPGSDQRRVADALRLTVRESGALLVADYGLGLLGSDLREAVSAARESFRLLVVDAHDLRLWRAARPHLVTPNWSELLHLLGVEPAAETGRMRWVCGQRNSIVRAAQATWVAVTLDREGAVLLGRDGSCFVRRCEVTAADATTAGAGDAFAAAITLALQAGLRPDVALDLAGVAASVVVQRPRTAVCDASSLFSALTPALTASSGPVDLPTLRAICDGHRRAGRRVVLTNGCFDVLTRGHVTYLAQARALGDVLVVGMNSDGSAERVRGPGGTRNQAKDRAAVVSALRSVDHVVVFDEDTAVGLVETLRPHVYVKGGDYTEQMVPEAVAVRRCGGEVRLLGYVPAGDPPRPGSGAAVTGAAPAPNEPREPLEPSGPCEPSGPGRSS